MEVRVRFEDGIWYGGTLRRNHRIGPLTRIDYDDGTKERNVKGRLIRGEGERDKGKEERGGGGSEGGREGGRSRTGV